MLLLGKNHSTMLTWLSDINCRDSDKHKPAIPYSKIKQILFHGTYPAFLFRNLGALPVTDNPTLLWRNLLADLILDSFALFLIDHLALSLSIRCTLLLIDRIALVLEWSTAFLIILRWALLFMNGFMDSSRHTDTLQLGNRVALLILNSGTLLPGILSCLALFLVLKSAFLSGDRLLDRSLRDLAFALL